MLNRRDFIKLIGAFGFVLTPLNKLLRVSSLGSQGEGSPEGELYEGFVLLDLDAPVPFFVESTPCPILCQVDETEAIDPKLDAYRGEISWFDSIESLKDNIDFRVFIPGVLPHKMTFLHGYVLRFAGTGNVWEARLDFGYGEDQEPLISLSAYPSFPRPYPIWPTLFYPKKEAGEFIFDEEYFIKKLEKISFTPERGVLSRTDQGYAMYWIKQDVLYTMSVEYDGWYEQPESVGKALIER